jgi:hypothetical protein
MNRIKFIFIAIFSLVIVNSCTVEHDQDAGVWSEDFEVKDRDWRLINGEDEIGSYFQYEFSGIPLDIAYKKGVVTVYRYENFGGRNEVQSPLPYTFYGVEETEYGEIYYSVLYTYDITSAGTIVFKIYVSDYFTANLQLFDEYFRVAITW